MLYKPNSDGDFWVMTEKKKYKNHRANENGLTEIRWRNPRVNKEERKGQLKKLGQQKDRHILAPESNIARNQE